MKEEMKQQPEPEHAAGGCVSTLEVKVESKPVEQDEYNGMHGLCCK